MLTLKAYAAVQAMLSAAPGQGTDAFDLAADLSGLYFANGDEAGEAQFLYVGKRTCQVSAHDDLCLTATLIDPFGNRLSFSTLKGIFVTVDPNAPQGLNIGMATAQGLAAWQDGIAHYLTVNPGNPFLACDVVGAGWAVSAGVHDTIGISAGSSGAVNYHIVLWGN